MRNKAMKKTNIQRLQKEKFKNHNLEWKISPKWGVSLPYVENEEAWYFNRKGTDVIYVQPKSPRNALAYCYSCRERILVVYQTVNQWMDDGPGPCAVGRTEKRQIMYCPNCEEKPKRSIIEIPENLHYEPDESPFRKLPNL